MVTDLSAHVPRTVPARFELIDDRFTGVDGDARSARRMSRYGLSPDS